MSLPISGQCNITGNFYGNVFRYRQFCQRISKGWRSPESPENQWWWIWGSDHRWWLVVLALEVAMSCQWISLYSNLLLPLAVVKLNPAGSNNDKKTRPINLTEGLHNSIAGGSGFNVFGSPTFVGSGTSNTQTLPSVHELLTITETLFLRKVQPTEILWKA